MTETLEEQIQKFKDYRGDKPFHISGGWTEYPGTPQEKHVPRTIVKGPIKRDLCKLCNEPIKEIKKNKPKRRAYKFCSDECRCEHDEIKKIRKKLGAVSVFWPPQKPPIPKKLLTYTLKGENGKSYKYKARKISRKIDYNLSKRLRIN